MDYDQLLNGCSEVGRRMLAAGAEIYRVEDTVRRMLAAYGVDGQVFAIPNTLIVSMTDETGQCRTRLCRTESAGSTDIEIVERFNALSRSVCAAPPPPEKLPELVRETANRCRRYSAAGILLGYFLGGMFFTLLFAGGNWLDALVGGGAALLAGLSVLPMDNLRVNFFFKTVAAAAILGAAVYSARAAGLAIDTGATIIGALMVLVPGLVFTNFMCDLLTGDPLSGTSTFIRAVLTAAAIAIGTGAALSLFRALNLPSDGIIHAVAYPLWAQLGFAFMACLGFGLLYNVHDWGVVLCCLGGALGWLVFRAADAAGTGICLQYLLSAIAISIYAEVMARVRKFPITAYLVVSFFPLVPGSYIYYTMYYAIQGQRQLFMETGLLAIGLAACLAIGVLLVSTTVASWTNWKRKKEARHGTL